MAADRIAAAFESHGKRAALMPYLMGGYPSPEESRAVGDVADGVIVGSRLVRAAGEGGAAAVGELVRGLSDALA